MPNNEPRATKAERARARAEAARKEAERLEAEELKAERMLTAAKVPTCPECGGRSFKIGAWTTVYQSIQFEEDADDTTTHEDCEWGDDYESGDHTDINDTAECNACGADVDEVLERFGWTFHADPQPRTPQTPPQTSTESQVYIDGGAKELAAYRAEQREPQHPRTGEPTNAARAARVDAALRAYAAEWYGDVEGEDLQTIVQDFMTDVLHWGARTAAAEGQPFDGGDVAARAARMTDEEQEQEQP